VASNKRKFEYTKEVIRSRKYKKDIQAIQWSKEKGQANDLQKHYTEY